MGTQCTAERSSEEDEVAWFAVIARVVVVQDKVDQPTTAAHAEINNQRNDPDFKMGTGGATVGDMYAGIKKELDKEPKLPVVQPVHNSSPAASPPSPTGAGQGAQAASPPAAGQWEGGTSAICQYCKNKPCDLIGFACKLNEGNAIGSVIKAGQKAEAGAQRACEQLAEAKERIDGYISRIKEAMAFLGAPQQADRSQGPAELSQHLFLGDIIDANDPPTLLRLGITEVVNCAESMPISLARGDAPQMGSGADNAAPPETALQLYARLNIGLHSFDADDDSSYALLDIHLADAYTFIDAAIDRGGKVLVHCFAGQNRSAAICCAYLTLKQRRPLVSVVAEVFEKRKAAAKGLHILTNDHFQRELVLMASSNGLLGKLPPSPQY
jgi:hypothetical protein